MRGCVSKRLEKASDGRRHRQSDRVTAPAPSREGAPAGFSRAAQAGLDPRQGAGLARLCGDAADREGERPAHRVRRGRLPQHRRVLGEEARDLHDHGRHVHARLRVLQREDRAARRARRKGAGACRAGGGEARPQPRGHHLGRPRRPRRRRRAPFRRSHHGDPRRDPADHDRSADAGFPAQGRRGRNRGRGAARRVQPQSRNRAVEISHGAAGRALFRLDPPVAAGEGARPEHVHQVRHHGRAWRRAERSAAADGRSARRRRRLPHHRAIPPADAQASRGDAVRAARRVQILRDRRLRQGLPDGVGLAADALLAPRGRRFRAAESARAPSAPDRCAASW